MGGESKTTSTQASTTAPWANAQPMLGGMLGQVGNGLDHTAVTGTENGALGTLAANGQNATTQFAPQVTDYAKRLLAGGGATDQAGAIGQNNTTYQTALQPFAAPGYSSMNDPAFRAQLGQIQTDVTNNVNGQFAAAGRDMSGANATAVARGVAAGQAPVIAAQHNQDIATQRGAQDAMYGAGNTTAGILGGLNQQGLVNMGQGVTAAGQATDANNAGANATLAAEAARRGIPVQALGMLANIGIPIAGLGSQSTGNSQGTQQMSGADQFGKIAGGFGSMFGGNSGGAVNNAMKLFG